MNVPLDAHLTSTLDRIRHDLVGLRAHSGEAGHLFHSEAGHLFRYEGGHHSDLMPATVPI